MASWSTLPIELRWEVLELVVAAVAAGHDENKLSTYATVSRDWQAFFEETTFRHLRITPSCIGEFGRIVHGTGGCNLLDRRANVRHIWLHVELAEYGCQVCGIEEDAHTTAINNVIFTNAMWRLLTILAGWSQRPSGEELVLEISAMSPSDGAHWFRSYRLNETYPHGTVDPEQLSSYIEHDVVIMVNGYEQGHDPDDGIHTYTLEGAVKRLRKRLDFDFRDIPCGPGGATRLPQVGVVTQFLVRRQFYRSIHMAALIRLFRECLVELRSFRFEQWQPAVPDDDPEESQDQASLLEQHIPSSVRTFSLFLDSEDLFHKWNERRRVRKGQGVALAKAIRTVEHAAVVFAADAMEFVDAFSRQDPADLTSAFRCHKLKTLTLTTTVPVGHPETNRIDEEAQVGRLFEKAAHAATFMPSLQRLEVLNPDPFDAFIFRYEVPDGQGPCELTWLAASKRQQFTDETSGYSPLALRPSVIQNWETVARTNARREMVFQEVDLGDWRNPWGFLLDELRSRDLMLHQTSQCQVANESEGMWADVKWEYPRE